MDLRSIVISENLALTPTTGQLCYMVVKHGLLQLRKECRLMIFKNRFLRQIFGPKRDGNEEWRRLHNEELHSSYRSRNIVRMINCRRLRWAGHVARMEEGRRFSKTLAGKPLKRPRCSLENNIRTDVKDMSVNTRNWVDFAEYRNYREPL